LIGTNYCSSARRLAAESLLFVLLFTFRFQFLATRVSKVSSDPFLRLTFVILRSSFILSPHVLAAAVGGFRMGLLVMIAAAPWRTVFMPLTPKLRSLFH
jgi:hypothetical protein